MYIADDYHSGPYTVTIPAGDNDVTFSVTITDDDIREMSETFNLIIDPSSLPNGVTSSNNATVTIMDQDGEWSNFLKLINYCCCVAISVNFSQLEYEIAERNKPAQPVLVLSNPSSTNIIITVQNTDITAKGTYN